MCVVAYDGSNIEVLSVQEFMLLKPREGQFGVIDVDLTILLDVPEENSTLFLLQRGDVINLHDTTMERGDSNNWINRLFNEHIHDRAMVPKSEELIEIRYLPTAKDVFRLPSISLDQWPKQDNLKELHDSIGHIPFSRITIAELPVGRCALSVHYISNYGIRVTRYQRHFQIHGPDTVLCQLPRDLDRIGNEKYRKNFFQIYEEAVRNFRFQEKQTYDIHLVGDPSCAHFLDEGQEKQLQSPKTIAWPNPSPAGGENAIMYSFTSGEDLDYSIRIASEIKR